ncbi:MAG: hypothetical protein AAGB51_08030 [Planctomycetota bacterium]
MANRRLDRTNAARLALASQTLAGVAIAGTVFVGLTGAPGGGVPEVRIAQAVPPPEPEAITEGPRETDTGPGFDRGLIRDNLATLRNAPREQVEEVQVVDTGPGPEQVPETNEPEVVQRAPGTEGIAYLGGIEDYRGRRAFVSVSGKQSLVRAGDDLEGWTIASISLDELTLENGPRRESIARTTKARSLAEMTPAERRERQQLESNRDALQRARAGKARQTANPTAQNQRTQPTQRGAGTRSSLPELTPEQRARMSPEEIEQYETRRLEMQRREQLLNNNRRRGTPQA